MDEKRRFQRVELSAPVYYETYNRGNALNVSEGGLCMVTDKPLLYGRDLTVMFSLPGEAHASVKSFGKVVWSKLCNGACYETGIQFWDMSPYYLKRIQSYVTKHST
jgi:hypothetical protein